MKRFQLALMVVGIILGVLLALQFRITREIRGTEPVQRVQELSAQLDHLKIERDAVQAQVDSLRSRFDRISADSETKEELERARIEAGVTELTGPGVEVTLNDSSTSLRPGENPNLFVLHDEDILKVLNELRAAGAEAISISGQRVLATTEVRCNGPTILLNKKRLAPPYIISAIGNPDTLENSLKMRGGVAETLQYWGIQVVVKKLPQVTVPAYNGALKFEYAGASG